MRLIQVKRKGTCSDRLQKGQKVGGRNSSCGWKKNVVRGRGDEVGEADSRDQI
jgi:hypothetical protein